MNFTLKLMTVNGYQIGLPRKCIILLSDTAVIAYGAGSHTGVQDGRHIKFSISASTYSIKDFNTKIKAAVLQQRQDCKAPQFKNLNLVIPKHCTFMTSNSFFIALGIGDSSLEKTTRVQSALTLGEYKTFLDTSPSPKLLSLHCRQINRVKIEVNGQTSSLLVYTQVSDFKAAFTLMLLVFLERDTHHYHLDFKLLDENTT